MDFWDPEKDTTKVGNTLSSVHCFQMLHTGLQIEGVLAYFTHFKCQKRIGDDVWDLKYVFFLKYLKFVKKCLIHLALAHLK
jgi:hypothetical protein